ncbi:MAG: hypothetical protein PUC90_02850 [Prevotella sp.]|nr:hypothetical protein [Prevotella sp.]
MGLDRGKLQGVWNTLRQGGYQKSYDEFEKSFAGNDNWEYRQKVYSTLKANVGGVADTYDAFFNSLQSEKKNESGNENGNDNGGLQIRNDVPHGLQTPADGMLEETRGPVVPNVTKVPNDNQSAAADVERVNSNGVVKPFNSAEYAQLSSVGKEVAEGVGLYSDDIAEQERSMREETEAADKREKARQEAEKERNAKLEEDQRKAYNDAVIADAYYTHDDYKPFRLSNAEGAPYIDVRTKQYTDNLIDKLYSEAEERKRLLTTPANTPNNAELNPTGENKALEIDKVDDPEILKEKALEQIKKDEWKIRQEAAKWANDNQGKAGDEIIDVERFAEYVYQRTIADALGKIDAIAVEKAKPKNDAEFVLSGLEDTVPGYITSALTTSASKTKARQRGVQEYAAKASMPLNVTRGTLSFATDAGMGPFAISGKISEAAIQGIVKKQLSQWTQRGLSQAAAMRMLQSTLQKKLGKGAADRIFKGITGGAVNLGSYNLMKSLAQQNAVKEWDFDETLKSTFSGVVGGAALGLTGTGWGEITKNLKGFPKILSNIAGLGIEAGTFTATGELEKWASGHSDEIHWAKDFYENVAMVIGMKVSSPASAKALFSIKKREDPYMPYMLSDAELSDMKATKEGYRLWRAVMKDGQGEEHIKSCYKDFMINSNCDFAIKQKVSLCLYNTMIRETPHVYSYERKENLDGDIAVTTLSNRGQRIETVHFNDRDKADAYCERLTQAIIQGDATSVNIESLRIASETLRREVGMNEDEWSELLLDGKSKESLQARDALRRKWEEQTTEFSFGEEKLEGKEDVDRNENDNENEKTNDNENGKTNDNENEDGKNVFGTIYTQFKGKAKEAIDFLLRRKEGNAVAALHHKDVGDIDLWYGNDKAGLKKIAAKHPEVLDDLQGVIDEMHVAQASENRVILESDTYKAVVSKMLGNEKTDNWLLSAYEKKETSASSSDIETEPVGKQNGTAPLQDYLSAGKVSKKVGSEQGKKSENGNENDNEDENRGENGGEDTDGGVSLVEGNYKAVLRSQEGEEPKEVTIISGELRMQADGRIDELASDREIYYWGDDGNIHLAAPKDFERRINENEKTNENGNGNDNGGLQIRNDVPHGLQIPADGTVGKINGNEKTNENKNENENEDGNGNGNGNVDGEPISADEGTDEGMTALGRIPKDANGEPIYEQTDSDTAWDAIVEQTGGDEAMALSVASSMLADKEARLKKAERAKPRSGVTIADKIAAEKERVAAVEAAKKEVELWKAIVGVTAKRRADIELERSRKEEVVRAARKAEEARLRKEREEAERIEREALNGVPDVVDDTPQDARARGYRRVNGHKVDRQEALEALKGKEVDIKFSNDNIPSGRIAVIESEQLQPSHIQGQRNVSFFIDEAQPKDRKDEASVLSAQRIAANIRPEEVASSVTAYSGAPTTNVRGEVVQGNNRSDALRLMWQSYPKQAAKYKEYLMLHADDFGLRAEDISSMKHPVLVNMIDVSDADAIKLGQFVAQDTESGGVERIKPKNAVQKMGDDMKSFANILLRSSDEEMSFSELLDRNASDVLRWMSQKGYISDTQYMSAFDTKGILTAEAKNDLRGIMYQSIFRDGNTNLEEMFNSLPSKAQKAILATAFRDYDSPKEESVISEIQDSIRVFYSLSQNADFADAKNYKDARVAVEGWMRQYQMDDVSGESYLPAENFSNFALVLAAMYKGHNQSVIQKTFDRLFDLIQGKQEATLFEEADNTPRSLHEAIKEILNIDYNGKYGSDVLANNNSGSQRRQRGSTGDAAGGERDKVGERTADSGGRTEADGGENRNDGERQNDLQETTEISGAERTEMEARIVDWLSEENLSHAVGKTREEIFEEFGNRLEPIAYIPTRFLSLVSSTLKDQRIYCGKGYFIDHALRNHSGAGTQVSPKEVDVSKYLNIQTVLDNPDAIKETMSDGKRTIVFIKKIGRFFAELTQIEENGKIVLHKSLFNQKKEPYAKLDDIRQEDTSSEGGISSISHAENSAPAISLQSRGDVILSENDEHTNMSSISAGKGKVNSSTTQAKGEKVAENQSTGGVQAALAAAETEVNTTPTEAQKEAGNYKKGHVKIDGYDVTIENPKGSVRRGTDASGKQWEQEMHNTYGYIRGTEGVDGDHIDVFFSEDPSQGDVFVVDQVNKDGSFDEHKVMYGFPDIESARKAYLSNYEDGWTGLGEITPVSKEEFKKWVESSHRKTKPFAEYKGVKATVARKNNAVSQRNGVENGGVEDYVSMAERKVLEKEAKRTAAGFAMETPEEAAVFDRRVGEMSDLELLSYIKDDGNGDVNKAFHPSVYDEYDYRHGDEIADAYDRYLQQLQDSNTPLEQAEEMLGNIRKDLSKLATEERAELLGQEEALENYIAKLENVGTRMQKVAEEVNVSSREEALRDALNDVLRGAGIEVITDAEEGQRVLDEVNNGARMQAMIGGLQKASDFIVSFLKGKTKQRSSKLEIPERANRLAERAIGHKIKSHTINANELTHSKKRHGINGSAITEKSIPLRDEDFALMPYIMSAPTRVVKGSMSSNGTESVRYEKDLSNGVVIVVEREGRFDVSDMENITMWAQKKSATNVTVAQRASHSTSGTIVISEADAAKIRKDAENAIRNDEKLREEKVNGFGPRYFRTKDGDAYGFTAGGKIYIDPRLVNAETPIHEYAHLWSSAMRRVNPEEWRNIVELMKGTSIWDEVKSQYSELKTDDDIADEVLSQYSGRRGAERLRAEQNRILDSKDDVLEKAAALSAIGRVKDALKRFWKGVADWFGIHFTTAEEVADKVLSDMLNGVDPRKVAGEVNEEIRYDANSEEAGIVARAKADGTYMKAPNGKKSKLSPRQWVQVRTKAFKKWFGDWEKAFKKNFLLNGKAVSSLNGDEFGKKEGVSLTDQVVSYYQTFGGKAFSPIFGDVVLDRDGVDDSLAHGMGRLKAVAYAAVKDVIEKGVLIDYDTNHKGRGYDSAVVAAPIEIDSKIYVCSVVVKRNKKGCRFYLHEVTEQKRLMNEGSNTGQNQPQHPKAFANILQKIVTVKENSSKVVDENGEPMVVYHQTNSTIFVNRKTGENFDNLNWKEKDYWQNEASEEEWNDTWEERDFYVFDNKSHGRRSVEMPAFFFSPIYDEHHEYGDRTVEAFLNIRNPIVNPDIPNRGVTDTAGEDAMNALIAQGYDGFIREYDGELREVNAFFPTQIKSADENVGTFDGANPDIRYQFVGEKGAGAMDKAEEASVRLDNLAVAREMESAGKDAKSVKLATGWERGADGKWRYEIEDGRFDRLGELHPERRRLSVAEQKELDDAFDETMDAFEKGSLAYKEEINKDTDMADIYEVGGMERKKAERIRDLEDKKRRLKGVPKKLDDYLENDELFNAYPQLRDIVIDTSSEGDAVFGRMGSYYHASNTIRLNDTSLSTLTHEVQHAIQHIEGFAKGGSKEGVRYLFDRAKSEWLARSWADELKEKAREMGEDHNQTAVYEALVNDYKGMESLMPKKEERIKGFNYFVRGYADRSLDNAIEQFRLNERTSIDSYDEYLKLAGEVEARNVQARLGMGAEERRASLASETEDVAREDQIILRDGLGVSNSESSHKTDLANVNRRFNKELQQQIDGKLPSNHIYRMGEPGQILLSTGVPDLPIQMNASRLKAKATSYGHDFELSEIKDLVKALQTPLAVFAYGDTTKAQNIIVPLQKDGKNFIVGLSLNPMVGGRSLEINSIRNVFPKNNSEWLNWISQGKALYLDKEKIQTLIDQQRTILADVEYLDLNSVAKVVENFENPKILDENVYEDTAEYRIREDEPPTKTGIGYKVFVLKNGKLYPPMVANPGGEATPFGVWLDADAAPVAGESKTGRKQVKSGGKGTQGGSGKLAYRPGWHLGEIPYALQFNRLNPETGEKELFPANFVWAEVEYANDVDYHEEAMSYGMNASGKFQHSLAGLPKLPVNGSYRYRTNPNPETDPWIISGAMKVTRILKPSEVDAMVEAVGRKPQQRQTGAVTDEQIEALNRELARTMQKDTDMKRRTVEQMGEKLHTDINIIEDVNEITHPDAAVQERRRRSKGWYDTKTGEITIVLANNKDVDDVISSVAHETIAHKGLRELVGEERYDEFLDEVYGRLRDDLKKGVDDAAGHAFMDDVTKNGKRAKSYEQHRRTAVDELFGRMAEKPFDEFTSSERSIWQKLKEAVVCLLDKLLGGSKLPKWFKLGDNELRYMLWRSKERLEHGRETALDVARDMSKLKELGIGDEVDTALYSDGGEMSKGDLDRLFDDFDLGKADTSERLMKGMVTLSEKNKGDVAMRKEAMRVIGGNLTKLRRAMSKQKEYDKKTVGDVVRMAKVLIGSGHTDSMTASEVAKLLTAVKNATGKNDITENINRVVSIMLNHELKEYELLVSKMLKKSPKKVGKNGVAVQGSMDLAGQDFVRALDEGKGMREEDLNERINDVADRFISVSTEEETYRAEAELKGLEAAQYYNKYIDASIREEKALENELRQLKTDYNEGVISREVYNETRAAIKESKLKNLADRVERYDAFVKRLSGPIEAGKQGAKDFMQKKIDHMRDVQHWANSDMQGISASELDKLPKVYNNAIVRALMSPSPTFDYMLKFFCRNNADGEGYLWNNFMRMQMSSSDAEWKNSQKSKQALHDKVSEVFGKKMKWHDIFDMERKMPKIYVAVNDAREEKVYGLTQGNAAYIHAVNKMSDGRMKLRRMGITDLTVAEIEEKLDPRLKSLVDWVQDEYLPKLRERYNEKHEKMFGASMAAIENYFPLKVNKRSRGTDTDINSVKTEKNPSTITGALIERTKNTLPLDIMGADAFDVILEHIDKMEHWYAYAEMCEDLNTLTNYKRFKNRVQHLSSVRFGSGEEIWKRFMDVSRIAVGSYEPRDAQLDKYAVNIAKGATTAAISGRVWTALKQLQSYSAYMSDADLIELAKTTNPVGLSRSWNWCIENLPGFAKRWKSRRVGDTRLDETDSDWGIWHNKIVQKSSIWGMTPNAFVDACTVAMGTKAIYETQKKRLMKLDYSEDQAHEKAIMKSYIAYNETQQSSEGAFVSAMQKDRTWASVGFSMFRNASFAYQRRLLHSMNTLVRCVKPGATVKNVEFVCKQMMREGLDEDMARRAAKRVYRRKVVKATADTVLFGFIVPFTWNLLSTAVYMMFGDDDKKKIKDLTDTAIETVLTSITDGVAGGSLIHDAAANITRGVKSDEIFNKSVFPAISEVERALRNNDMVSAVNDLTNAMVSMYVGVNPRTITDAVVGIVDYLDNDPESIKEFQILMLRLMNAPQSQIEELYLDELGMNARDAKTKDIVTLAKRYAKYKRLRNAPLTTFLYSNDDKERIEDKWVERFWKKVREESLAGSDDIDQRIEEYEQSDEYKDIRDRLQRMSQYKHLDPEEYRRRAELIYQSPEYVRYRTYDRYQKYIKIFNGIRDFDNVDRLKLELKNALDETEVSKEAEKELIETD